MQPLKTFDSKAIIINKNCDFKKEIYANEIVWTYIVGKYAEQNKDIYNLISGFQQDKSHAIYIEGQTLTPYKKIEGNSYIDMALGSIGIRAGTESGMKYDKSLGSEICFVEAKYLSDLSVKTKHSPVRNQMDRVIENLICFEDSGQYPKKIVFTLLTPRLFKDNFGSRLYSYKFHDYTKLLSKDKNELATRIELKNCKSEKRFKFNKETDFIRNRLKSLSLNWVTYEDVFEILYPDLKYLDITKLEDAELIWNKITC
jgi:hypothetical protein